jgi:CAAX protease family protein
VNAEAGLLPEGRLASFLRFGFSLPLLLFAFFAAGFLAASLPARVGWLSRNLTALFWFDLILFPGVLIVYKLLTHFLDHKPLGSVGYAFHERWLEELGTGVALGGGAILMVGGFERLAGLAKFSPNPGRNLIEAGPIYLVVFLIGAATEELLFRGYPFQRLIEAFTPAGAVLVSSVIFAVVHMENPFHTWLSTINTALVGVGFAIAYLRTRALWLPLGIHFSWNYLQGCLLGLPISGIGVPKSFLICGVHGARWLTGGPYGPEGGVAGTIVILALTAYLAFSPNLHVSKTMQAFSLPSD